MNTLNLQVHQRVITQHPHLVETYEQFVEHDEFESIKLAFNVDNNSLTKTESTYGKLTAVVT